SRAWTASREEIEAISSYRARTSRAALDVMEQVYENTPTPAPNPTNLGITGHGDGTASTTDAPAAPGRGAAHSPHLQAERGHSGFQDDHPEDDQRDAEPGGDRRHGERRRTSALTGLPRRIRAHPSTSSRTRDLRSRSAHPPAPGVPVPPLGEPGLLAEQVILSPRHHV